jgi:hypothetical protein
MIMSMFAFAVQRSHAAHSYSCSKYGYVVTIPSGWTQAKPDALKCVVRAGDFTSQSSPLYWSPTRRAFFQIDVIENKTYSATQWIKDYTAIMGVSARSIKIGATIISGIRFAVVASPLKTVDSAGKKGNIFLVIAGVQHKGRMYGFLGGVGLDGNASPNSDVAQLRIAFTSIKIK